MARLRHVACPRTEGNSLPVNRKNAGKPQLSEFAQLATEHGLVKVGERPPLGRYIRDLWARRSFLWTMATAKSYSQHQNNYLGQLWTILNPLLLAAVYYLVFGVLLDTTRGVENFTAFLTIGIFIFLSFSATVNSGANSIISNIDLVRALHFPRAVLPISVAVSEILNLLPAIVVMFGIVILTGEPVAWTWLLVPIALLLIVTFTSGVCMLAARIVTAARDLRNLIPVGVRLLRYVSGVFFSIEGYVSGALGLAMEYQPVALYITLIRACMMEETAMTPQLWVAGVGWALVLFVIGFLVFWRGEGKYGLD